MDASKPVKQSVTSVRGFIMRNKLSATIFVVSVLYSTVFVEYLAPAAYFDAFKNEILRGVLIAATAVISMADPRIGVVVLVAVLRTFSYVRKEDFMDMSEIAEKVGSASFLAKKEKYDNKKSDGDSESDSDSDSEDLDEDMMDDMDEDDMDLDLADM